MSPLLSFFSTSTIIFTQILLNNNVDMVRLSSLKRNNYRLNSHTIESRSLKMRNYILKEKLDLSFISLVQLKVQMSYYDHIMSVVRLFVRLCQI